MILRHLPGRPAIVALLACLASVVVGCGSSTADETSTPSTAVTTSTTLGTTTTATTVSSTTTSVTSAAAPSSTTQTTAAAPTVGALMPWTAKSFQDLVVDDDVVFRQGDVAIVVRWASREWAPLDANNLEGSRYPLSTELPVDATPQDQLALLASIAADIADQPERYQQVFAPGNSFVVRTEPLGDLRWFEGPTSIFTQVNRADGTEVVIRPALSGVTTPTACGRMQGVASRARESSKTYSASRRAALTDDIYANLADPALPEALRELHRAAASRSIAMELNGLFLASESGVGGADYLRALRDAAAPGGVGLEGVSADVLAAGDSVAAACSFSMTLVLWSGAGPRPVQVPCSNTAVFEAYRASAAASDQRAATHSAADAQRVTDLLAAAARA